MQQSTRSMMNPCLLHLQKLGLELKCPLCLNLLKRPSLLPCDHIFCNSCLPKNTQFPSECPVCKEQYVDQDLRSMRWIQNMVTIYRSLEAAFPTTLFQATSFDAGKELCKAAVTDEVAQVALMRSVGANGDERNGEQHAISPTISSQVRIGGHRLCATVQTDLSQVEQLLLGSPPSSGDVKGSDNDSNDRGYDDSPQNYGALISVKRNADDGVRQYRSDISASGTEEGHLRDSKRQKMLNYSALNAAVDMVAHVKPTVCQSENLVTFHPRLEPTVCCTSEQTPAMLESVASACGFCQSSRISEDTGPMLHYVNGRPVEGDKATLSNVIHVHRTCIEWAPQVYFVGENVKNLKAELARGAKLKCSRCGLKGAALGCYLKSCRKSYHFPCAMKISGCRWDDENFLVLCPAHSSLKFPNEKTKSEKRSVTQISPQQSDFWLDSCYEEKKWLFCGSALSSEEKCLLVEFGSMIGVRVTKSWNPNVTHVIAATDSDGAYTRTLKVLMAILNGKWILSVEWIKACMEAKRPVDEEPYEVSLDNYGCRYGPRYGRLSILNKAPKLFDGLSFYFVGDFLPANKEDLQNLVLAAGGTFVESEEALVSSSDLAKLVVYSLDPPEGSELGDEVSMLWQRHNEADNVAAKAGAQVVGHTWLLESIAAYKLPAPVS